MRKRYPFSSKIGARNILVGLEKALQNQLTVYQEIADITSYFLPNEEVLNVFPTQSILSNKFSSGIDGWDPKDLGSIPDRAISTFIDLSIQKMEWSVIIASSQKCKISLMMVKSPMNVIIVEVECDNHHDLSNFKAIPEDMDIKRYFNRKIAMAGASSSGKTETARQLTAFVNIEFGGNAEHATEYARSFILRYGIPDWKLQPFLEQGQGRREADIGANNVVISDGPRFLNTIYTRHYFADRLTPQNIYILHKIYKKSIQALTEYTDIIYCIRQSIKEDGCRFQSEDDNVQIDTQIRSLLKDHNVPFISHNVRETSVEDLAKKIFFINQFTFQPK